MAPPMFDYEPRKEKTRPGYTVMLVIIAVVAPVFLVFIFLGKENIGLKVVIVLAMAMLAVITRWELHKHFWFWAVVIVTLALQFPLLFMNSWLKMTWGTIRLLGLAEFLLFFVVIWFADAIAERFFPPSATSGDYDR